MQENIRDAAIRVGRDPEEITLVAVTKTIDTDMMNQAIKLGIKNIGENRVQEIQRKHDLVIDSEKLNWHMIGHLQSNKVKYIIDKVSLIHSLDRISLAKELQKRAKQINKCIDTLIQVNISEEQTKFGLKKDEVIKFIESVSKYNNIKIKGLMTIAPYHENPENIRYVFKQLKELSESIEAKKYKNIEMKYLSMGMTNDYQIAIEEGANIVRIGTGLFGKRIYK